MYSNVYSSPAHSTYSLSFLDILPPLLSKNTQHRSLSCTHRTTVITITKTIGLRLTYSLHYTSVITITKIIGLLLTYSLHYTLTTCFFFWISLTPHKFNNHLILSYKTSNFPECFSQLVCEICQLHLFFHKNHYFRSM